MSGSGLARALSLLTLISLTFLVPEMEGQIAIAPSSVAFGNVLVGSSQTQTVNITNVGNSNLSISQVGASGAGYTASGLNLPYVLFPGRSVSLNVTFTPPTGGAAMGAVSASASVPYGGHKRWRYNGTVTAATASLTGTGTMPSGTVTASPATLNFGSISQGTSQSLTETISNSGTGNVTISQASMSSAAFGVNGLVPPTTLGAGQSITFSVVYSPTSSGTVSGTLSILSNASDTQLSIALAGTGAPAGQLTLTPTSLNFGNVTNGSSSILSGTLTASGSSVTVASASSTSAEFSLSGISLPMSVSAGQSVPFSVTFLPQATGTATASLSFLNNTGGTLATGSLTGSGVAAVQHNVSLSWSPSTSTGIVGYNVYRGAILGGPYTQVSSEDTGSSYTDTTVSAGQIYYYVVTAVDSTGTESLYSNQAQAAVPSP